MVESTQLNPKIDISEFSGTPKERVCRENMMSKKNLYGTNRTPKVSVITVTHNAEPFIRQYLISLKNQTFRDFEVIILDNASKDQTVQLIRKMARDIGVRKILLLKSQHNTGFCAGNNLGVSYSRGEYIVFLNQDCFPEPGWLKGLLEAAQNAPKDVAVFQSLILYEKGRIRTAGNFVDKYGMFVCARRFSPINDMQFEIDFFYASGASMMLKRDLFLAIGGFDEELFMYGDDFDLCWRLRLLGYKTRLAVNSKCIHLGGEYMSSALSPLKYYFIQRSRITVLLKNYSLSNVIRYVPMAVTLQLLGSIYLSLRFRNSRFILITFQAIKWNLKKLRSTLIHRWNVQKIRKIHDKLILQSMIRGPLEIIKYLKGSLSIDDK